MDKPRKDVVREQAETVTSELREKIRSKMDVGKFFAGFITLLIGILLNDGGPSLFLSKVGIVFFISSLGFCVAAIFCYDRLLMPREYWTALAKEEKTEEKFQDHLREEMVRSWTWLFVPAVFCFGLGFLLVLSNAVGIRLDETIALAPVWLIILSIVGVLIPIWLGYTKGPSIYD